MKLVSRSAGIRITTFEELLLRSPSLSLSSSANLNIQNGIEYFDLLQAKSDEDNDNSVDGKDMKSNNNILTQPNVVRSGHQGIEADGKGNNGLALRAYNLVATDGILMALA